MQEDTKCIICLQSHGRIGKLKCKDCKHVRTHSNCMEEWLKTKNMCPQCEQPISNLHIKSIKKREYQYGKFILLLYNFTNIYILFEGLLYIKIYKENKPYFHTSTYLIILSLITTTITKLYLLYKEYKYYISVKTDTLDKNDDKNYQMTILMNSILKVFFVFGVLIYLCSNMEQDTRFAIYISVTLFIAPLMWLCCCLILLYILYKYTPKGCRWLKNKLENIACPMVEYKEVDKIEELIDFDKHKDSIDDSKENDIV